MAKENSKGLSMADIICTLGMLAMLFFLFCGFCYEGDDLQMSAIMTIGIGLLLLLPLLVAIYLKKSKPFNKWIWRALEYAAIAVYLIIAAFTIEPIGKFIATEWTKNKDITEALEKDRDKVSRQVAEFINDNTEHLNTTVRSLNNYLSDRENGYTASPSMRDFIREYVMGGLSEQGLSRSEINEYRDKELDAINFIHNLIQYNFYDSVYAEANIITRPQKVSDLIDSYHRVDSDMESFINEHPYPNFSKSGSRYEENGSMSLSSVDDNAFSKSKFEKVLGEIDGFNLIALLIIILLNLCVLLPYIVTIRQTLVRTVDKSGRDIGGTPLIQQSEWSTNN